MIRKLEELITDKISGEWGNEGTPETGVKVIRTANFTNAGVINFDNLVYREIDPRKVVSKRLQTGDIIIEKSGGSPTQPVGRVVFFDLKTDEPFLCNNFTSVLRPNKKLVYPKYLFYRLFEGHKEGRTLKYQNKTTGIINLKLENYLQEKLNIPNDLEDQIRIANILSKAETLISQRKESLRLLEELLKSRFLDMFGQGIDSKFPISKLSDVSTKITDGEHGTVKRVEKGRLYLMARNITVNNLIDLSDVSFISENDHRKIFKRCNPQVGDLMMVCVGATIGKVALVPNGMGEFSMARSVALIKPDQTKIISEYLLWFFNSELGIRQIKSSSNEAAQAGLYTGKLKEIKIPIPPIKLQTQFAHIVEKTEVLKAHYQTSLQELENLYGSLSQKAFRGELDFTKAAINTAEAKKDVVVAEKISEENKREEVNHFEEYFEDEESKPHKPNEASFVSLIVTKFGRRYFTFEDLKQEAKSQNWVYDFDSFKKNIFNLIRSGKLEQIFMDSMQKSKLVAHDLMLLKDAEETIFLRATFGFEA